MGCSISNHRACGSGLWIWRYRGGISGHRETSVLYIPCAVRNLLDFRVAGQRRALSYNEVPVEYRLPLGKAVESKVPGAGKIGSLVCFALCAFCAVLLKRWPSSGVRHVAFVTLRSVHERLKRIPHLNPLPFAKGEADAASRSLVARRIASCDSPLPVWGEDEGEGIVFLV
jgi:hypothetical protein